MFRGNSFWAGVVSGGLSQINDSRAYSNGVINRGEYAANTTCNVTSAVGVMAGVEYGAMLGSAVMPGIGTVAGAMIGGVIGDRVGRTVGTTAGSIMFKR
ncbi:hypothetical protein [Aneurinibacillus terranovensis]|uniref:hypothetical protein n=1 Tax=Aneurinibacillus terranovensis TaxID=278991 RepID=UPI0004094955|nr:hypothetical protein [Aneurinibacillus terranovensis]